MRFIKVFEQVVQDNQFKEKLETLDNEFEEFLSDDKEVNEDIYKDTYIEYTIEDIEMVETNLSKANEYLQKNSKYVLSSEMVKQGLKK